MDRPLHLGWSEKVHSPWPRVAAFTTAGVIELAVIYAVATGLALHVITTAPQILRVAIVKPETPKKELTPPMPRMQLVQPSAPQVPPPIINIQTPPNQPQITTVQTPHPVAVPPAPTVVQQVQPPARPAPPPVQQPPAPPTPPSAIAATHTQPPYPMIAVREGQQGTVQLNISVAADGSVQDVSVTESSGSQALDDAAIEWIKEHWRYRPATRNGQAVVANTRADVVFNLQQARSSGVL